MKKDIVPPPCGFSSAFEIEKTLNKSESKLNAVLSEILILFSFRDIAL